MSIRQWTISVAKFFGQNKLQQFIGKLQATWGVIYRVMNPQQGDQDLNKVFYLEIILKLKPNSD